MKRHSTRVSALTFAIALLTVLLFAPGAWAAADDFGVTVSEPEQLDTSFAPPYTYEGRYFSDREITGANIAFEQVVTITVPPEALELDDEDAAEIRRERIQECLDYADSYHATQENAQTLCRVVLPDGEYQLGSKDCAGTLTVHAGTWLDMTAGTKLMRANGAAPLLQCDADAQGIAVDGGALSAAEEEAGGAALVAFSSAQDVIVRDVSFFGSAAMCGAEFAGVKGATVANCTFSGMTQTGSCGLALRNVRDASCVGHESSPADTPCENVVVGNSSFVELACGLSVRRHGASLAAKELLVQHNSIVGATNAAVQVAAARNIAVRDNSIGLCARGIALSPCADADDAQAAAQEVSEGGAMAGQGHCLVQSNEVFGAYATGPGIDVSGARVGSNMCGLEDLLFKNNNVSTHGAALRFADCSGVAVEGGEYLCVDGVGITVGPGLSTRLDNVTCYSQAGIGLYVQQAATVQLGNCTMDSCGKQGLFACKAHVEGMGCSFDGCASDGVSAEGGELHLVGCAARGCSANGVRVCGAAQVVLAGMIATGNKGAGVSASGAEISMQGCVCSSNGKQGLVAASSNVTLDACTLKSNASHAVSVSKSTSLVADALKIASNKGAGICASASVVKATALAVKSNGKAGLALSSGGKATLASCTFSSNKGSGITAKKSTLSLSKCTCKSNGSHGLYVSGGKTSVKSCAFASNKGSGVRAASKAKITAFKKNTLKKNKKYGIYASGKSKVKGFSGNKFSGNKKGKRKGF